MSLRLKDFETITKDTRDQPIKMSQQQDEEYLNDQQRSYLSEKLEEQPTEQYKCSCTLCYKEGLRSMPVSCKLDEGFKDTKLTQRDQDYAFIVKRLSPIDDSSKCLRIPIPEICFFTEKGEIESVVYCSREDRRQPLCNYVTNRNQTTMNAMRRFFQDRRKVYQKVLEMNLYRGEGSTQTTPRLATGLTLNRNLITIRTKYIMKKSREETQEENFGRSIQESILLKYLDGTTQILSEAEISNLLISRRRIDWTQVIYAQQYYKPERGHNLQSVKFLFQRDRKHHLFQKAEIEVLLINNEISKASEDYITMEKEEDYEQKLSRSNEEDFLKYQSFKIYHFIHKFAKVQLIQAQFEFLKDDLDQYFLFNASHVLHKPAFCPINENITDDLFHQKSHRNRSDDHSKVIENDPQIRELTSQLKFNYQTRKEELGINKQYSLPQDFESELEFKRLYPNRRVIDFSMHLKPNKEKRKVTKVDVKVVPSMTDTITTFYRKRVQNESRSTHSTNTHTRAGLSRPQPQPSFTFIDQFTQPRIDAKGARPKTDIKMRPKTSSYHVPKNSSSLSKKRNRALSGISSEEEKHRSKNGTLPNLLFRNIDFSSPLIIGQFDTSLIEFF